MKIIIDGRKVSATAGETVLTVARRNGIEIPTLCHHEALEAVGACRLCLVEITHDDWNGWKGLVTSCLYPVEDGLQVATDNDAVRRQRQTVLDLLVARCPESTVIRELAEQHGEVTSYVPFEDGSKCIMCTLCVRACEAVGPRAISTVSRGNTKAVEPPFLGAADACIGCGSCAAVCPTGHIVMTDDNRSRTIWGRKFAFVECESCGKPTITEEHRDFAVETSNIPADYYSTCATCKRAKLSKHFAQVGA